MLEAGMSIEQPQGTIFLSHSSNDKAFVERIYARLDKSNTFYDLKSIGPGEEFIDAMRDGVGNCAVFVLFHSPTNASSWVEFEKHLAEIRLITNNSAQIIVCPINGSNHETLPDWMKRFMTTTSDFSISDIVRAIKHSYDKAFSLSHPDQKRIFPGREALQREISLEVMRSAAASGKPLSAIVLTGVQGMGRGTLAAELVRSAFRGMRPGGPVFDLPDSGDAVDWHLKFYADLHDGITPETAAQQKEAFEEASPSEQAKYLLTELKHWGALNQVVTIRNRWGMRDKGNLLRPWMNNLLELLKDEPSIKLVLISERQLPKEAVDQLGNVRQFSVEELDIESIEYILSDRINPRYLDAQKLPLLASTAHGHPATANYVAYLINSGRSMESLSSAPEPIAAFQDRVLGSIFDANILSDVQKRILKLLSWFPRLSTNIICEVFESNSKKELLSEIWELVDFSLLDQTGGGRYKAPAVVSSAYRRRTDEHDRESFSRVARILSRQFESGDFDFDLIESLVVGIVSAGENLSNSILRVITTSRLLPVMEKEYYEGLSKTGEQAAIHYKRCVSLAQLAIKMPSSDDALENLLFFGADSSVRLSILPDKILAEMRARGFSAADYIAASYKYHVERDFEGAARSLARNVSGGGFRMRNVRLLARIYLRLGKFSDALTVLEKIYPARLARDTGLTIMKVKSLRGLRRYAEAEALLSGINSSHDDYGDVALYKAGAAIRAFDYSAALSHISEAKRAPKANRAVLTFLECSCQIESGDDSGLASACDLARAMRRDADALQLQARAALRHGD
ncbi:toll/interleukin-1 receptor domain-containing protein [Caulobacter radicis]|uniref:TIR domain-containing protein n=1 Tax=Caulobacter radicis TaxID=2172650 RepID=A0A2T9JJ77_9CAUL|nr:toll/interleukin-1 receptor domain-containing protein [Caulobacter radicis]PVM83747.1 hypothetical protein DDF65_09355 [Caulobacter radicis]